MNRYAFVQLFLAGTVAVFSSAASAEDQEAVIQRGKKATVLVDIQSREFGTAFCVDRAGLFVTNAHVVQRALQGGRILLVLQPGETAQKVVQASVVRSDPAEDLALLRLNGAADNLEALELGGTSGLFETKSLTAFGYPFGRLLAERGSTDYPSVTVSTGRVTSLRKRGGELEHIQLDASLNPGNSGGPVLDSAGKVVGIVQAGVPGSGVNFAIPVEKLNKLLDTPQILFEPPAIAFDKRHEARDFVIKVASFGKSRSTPLSVKLSLRNGSGTERSVQAKQEDDAYHATAVPIAAVRRETRVQVTANYSGGSISGWAVDAPIRCGTRKMKLSEVRQIETGAAPRATLTDGTQESGSLAGLELDLDLGGATIHTDLAKAGTISIAPQQEDDAGVQFKISVMRDGKVLAESAGSLPIGGPAVAGAGDVTHIAADNRFSAPPLAQDRVEVKLPAPVDDVIAAGGGRYLILPIKKLGKVAVFDAKVAKVTKYLSIPPSDVVLAAGAEKLFIILPDQKIVQRWDLATFRREVTAVLPINGTVTAAAMGSNSRGPLLLRWVAANSPVETGQFTLVNATTLQSLAGLKVNVPMINMGRGLHIRASASGDVFGLWSSGVSPSGLGLLVVEGNKVESRYEHTSVGYVQPGPDGRAVFTGSGGLYTEQLRRIGAATNNGTPFQQMTVPANAMGYYISLANPNGPPPPGGQAGMSATLCLVGNDRPLATLPKLDELSFSQQEIWAPTDFTIEKRVHFLATADLLITIPPANDELVLRRFNVVDALNKSGVDYLFVSSSPPPVGRRGELYRYPIEVKSEQGGVSCRLESGPDGMTVSPAGLVTWRVPQDATDTSVIIAVRDASGQEVFHTFTLSFPATTSAATPNR